MRLNAGIAAMLLTGGNQSAQKRHLPVRFFLPQINCCEIILGHPQRKAGN